MTIIRPGPNTGLHSLLNNVSSLDASVFKKNGYSGKIELFLPKFKINSEINLKEPLMKLGMKNMFGPGADFTTISDKQPLYVSDFKQKAFIEVNEKGSEAAASTGIELALRMSGPVDFSINRPSLFLITVKNLIVFMGVIGDPEY